MLKALKYAFVALALLSSCGGDEGDSSGGNNTPVDPAALVEDASRKPFYRYNPVSSIPSAEVASEEYRLEFGGWGSELPSFALDFPEGDSKRVIMEYTMGSFGSGPAAYDYTTMIFIKDKSTDCWYEIARSSVASKPP